MLERSNGVHLTAVLWNYVDEKNIVLVFQLKCCDRNITRTESNLDILLQIAEYPFKFIFAALLFRH